MKKAIIAGVLLVTTLLFAASCGKKCSVCEKNSMGGEELFGQFICDKCIDDMNDMLGGLSF